ncbi:MAG: hypothetical protein BWY78_00096 [Alphaproteobacteria bacterium ADurb.Bin438]|nr:MAG: hypothetical protein BWY78_00096 [Alphaproteobacteria bacterium ADurb.Bin438]
MLKGEKDKPSEILSVDEFENNFISNDKKRANNLIKVAIHSTHEQSMELAKKFQDEFNFNEKGLTSDIKEPKEFDRGLVAFMEDIGARKEQVERESTEVAYTISKQGACARGREEVFEFLRYSAVKNGAMDNNFYANFTEGGLKKEKESIIYRVEAQDLYPELRKKQAQQRF